MTMMNSTLRITVDGSSYRNTCTQYSVLRCAVMTGETRRLAAVVVRKLHVSSEEPTWLHVKGRTTQTSSYVLVVALQCSLYAA